jgi:hypothetical protein
VVWIVAGAELWNRAVTTTTESAIRLVERPRATMLTWKSNAVVIHRSDSPDDVDLDYRDLDLVTFNVVLLLALVWATPRVTGFSNFLPALAALAVLFASHILHFSLAIETIYATQLGEWRTAAYAPWQREVIASGRYFFDIALKYALPLALWGLLILVPRLRSLDAKPGHHGTSHGRRDS